MLKNKQKERIEKKKKIRKKKKDGKKCEILRKEPHEKIEKKVRESLEK